MVKSFAFSVGLMLSPEALTTIGNLAGRMPAYFVILLSAGVLCHTVTSRVYGVSVHPRVGRLTGETDLISHALGPGPALFFSLFPKLLMFLCLSTSVLVMAGYAFNEVFVLWFPNLGFSFCLMALVMALSLAGARTANAAQVLFITVSALGLLVLVAAGLATVDYPGGDTVDIAFPGREVLSHLFFPLMILIGFELSMFSSTDGKPPLSAVRAMVWAVVGMGFFLGVWGLVSLAHVSDGTLAASTLPHSLAARVIMGRSGRLIMGIVVISGTCGAVNVLLASVSRLVSAMARDGLIPAALVSVRGRAVVPPVLLAGGVFAMMGAGMGGKPILADLTMAAAWFWLASYAVAHLSFQVARGSMSGTGVFLGRVMPALSAGSLLFLALALAWVFFSIEAADASRLAKVLIAYLAFSAACAAVLLRLRR